MIKVISGSQFPKFVIPLIDESKESIRVVVFDWRWYPHDSGASCQLFNQSIVRASRRGVKVTALVNNDQIAKFFNDNGCVFKRLISRKLLHCKLMIIDNKIAITGSHNYSQSAFQMNFELSLILDDPETVSALIKFFDNLLLL